MKKTFLACVAAGSLALTAGAGVAAEGAHKAHHRDASKSTGMNSAQVTSVKYDSVCRAEFGFGSTGYTDCLQRLPATALVAR